MPNVSVVIPTYNRAEHVMGAVRSALDQSRPPAELIVVDDGSTDETPDLFAEVEAPVRYVRQENAGVSAARNRGVREATGDWIAFLDSDDRWHPDKIERQLAAHGVERGVRWSTTNAYLVPDTSVRAEQGYEAFERGFPLLVESGQDAGWWFSRHLRPASVGASEGRRPVYVGDLFPILLRGNLIQPSGLMIERKLFERVGGFREDRRLAEETDLSLRLAATGATAAVVMAPLYRWVVGDYESLTSSQNTAPLIRNALESLEKVVGRQDSLSPAERMAYEAGRTSLHRRLAYTLLSDLSRGDARGVARDVMKAEGFDAVLALVWSASFLPTPVLRLVRRIKSWLA